MHDITGGRSQQWISRDGLQRAFTRHAATVAFVSLALAFFLGGALAYVASLPREVPVYLAPGSVPGSVVPLETTVTADDSMKQYLLVTWLGAWRLGCQDPKGMCARQTSALVSSATGDPVAATVKAYNQAVADGKWKVAPSISDVTGSGNDFEIDWNEVATNSSGQHVERVMRAIIAVDSAPQYRALHNAVMMNPFGVFIKDLRLIESDVKR